MKILLIEDNLKFVKLFRYFIEDNEEKFSITYTHLLKEALDHLEKENFDAVVLDMYLPDSQGIDSISRIQEKRPQVPIIFLTSLDDADIRQEAFNRGAKGYLLKDQIVNHFTPTLRNALKKS